MLESSGDPNSHLTGQGHEMVETNDSQGRQIHLIEKHHAKNLHPTVGIVTECITFPFLDFVVQHEMIDTDVQCLGQFPGIARPTMKIR